MVKKLITTVATMYFFIYKLALIGFIQIEDLARNLNAASLEVVEDPRICIYFFLCL